jgi:hypothetical protein
MILIKKIFEYFSIFINKGESFQTNTFNEDDLNNIDYVADTLMALVNEIISQLFRYINDRF